MRAEITGCRLALTMLFNTQTNLDKARELINSDDEKQLYYACLELRYALEKIAYHKLRLRLDKITIEEIAAWQPRRALDRLMELVDENLDQDSILRMGPEEEFGVAPPVDKFVTVGQTKGINPKEIGKHWQKLGSHLHISMPNSKHEQPEKPSSDNLKTYLKEVVNYIEKLCSSNFDAHFSQNVTTKCSKCEQSIIRNAKLLNEGDIVQCQNNECPASYIVHKEKDEFIFEPFFMSLDCNKCGEKTYYHANIFLKIPYTSDFLTKCHNCQSIHKVRWSLEYALLEQ